MNGQYSAFARSFGAEEYIGVGSFKCNGGASPAVGNIIQQRGLPFTVAYTATGIYTLQFTAATKLPKRAAYVDARIQSALADYADVLVIENSLHLPANRLVFQLNRAGVAQAPPADANNAWISFEFVGTNNTGA